MWKKFAKKREITKFNDNRINEFIAVINFHSSDGGRFATGTIAKTYRSGQTIIVDVKLTTAHWGYFEFRIGEFDNKKVIGDRYGKLQGHLLKQVSSEK